VSRRHEHTAIQMRTPEWKPAGRYGGLPVGHIVGWADAVRNLVADFYAAVAGVTDASLPSLYDGVRAAELVEHALCGAREGVWVEC
jgi:hypothetical protein